MQFFEHLSEGVFYHIYNRGINSEPIYREDRNYDYFMNLYWNYISPVADTYCYSLLKSHFNFLIRIKDVLPLYEPPFRPPTVKAMNQIILPEEPLTDIIQKKLSPSNQFSNLFNSYAQAFNKAYNRTGGLFQTPFRRKSIHSEYHLRWITRFIHTSPQHHELTQDFKQWPHSSWHSLFSNTYTRLKRNDVISWFGGYAEFIEFHQYKEKTNRIILLNGLHDDA